MQNVLLALLALVLALLVALLLVALLLVALLLVALVVLALVVVVVVVLLVALLALLAGLLVLARFPVLARPDPQTEQTCPKGPARLTPLVADNQMPVASQLPQGLDLLADNQRPFASRRPRGSQDPIQNHV